MSDLRLRPVRVQDEAAFLEAHRQLLESDDFLLGLHYRESMSFAEYVDVLANMARGLEMAPGMVPDTHLIAVVGDTIVGRTSIRHELNDFLAREGGHIGYGVLEPFRRRGYATEILRQSLTIARSLGIESALLTCDDHNIGSATVIERCGGVLRDTVTASDGVPKRRYDIAL